jgi:hypothetical protein
MDKKVAVISALVEGCSVRMTGVAKGTILRLLAEVGEACAEFHNVLVRNVSAKRIQVDEIWSFVGAKQKNVTVEMAAKKICGDIWTFTAIEAQNEACYRLDGWKERRGVCDRVSSGYRRALVESRSAYNGRAQDVFERCH